MTNIEITPAQLERAREELRLALPHLQVSVEAHGDTFYVEGLPA